MAVLLGSVEETASSGPHGTTWLVLSVVGGSVLHSALG
jgi:hypothetical protein